MSAFRAELAVDIVARLISSIVAQTTRAIILAWLTATFVARYVSAFVVQLVAGVAAQLIGSIVTQTTRAIILARLMTAFVAM